MTKQIEALRLADALEDDLIGYDGLSLPGFCQNIANEAAAELRRLHDLLGKANALNRIRCERIKLLTAQRDEMLKTLKQYHKLSASDGWYADLVKDTIANTTGEPQ